MTDLPAPLVAPDVDLRDFAGFMLNVNRLLASELVALGTPEQCWAATMLWCRAWHQVPAASLPDDDRVLAAYSGAGKRWGKVKEMALRGFVKCSDGRLYHKVLAEDAMRAWDKSRTNARRARAGAQARWKETNPDAPSMRQASDKHAMTHPQSNTSDHANAMLGDAQGQGQGQGQGQQAQQPEPRTPDAVASVGEACLALCSKQGIDVTLWNWGIIPQWLANGWEPERHIYPTIKRLLAEGRRPSKSLDFFTKAIAEFVAKSRANGHAAEDDPSQDTPERVLAARLKATAASGKWFPEWGPRPGEWTAEGGWQLPSEGAS